jgi:hypothetical protein
MLAAPSDTNLPWTNLNQKHTVQIILEIRKVAKYVETKLMEEHRIAVQTIEVTFSAEANAANAAQVPGPHMAILHQGCLLPSVLSLNTVKRYLDDGRTEVCVMFLRNC